jgi:aspartate/methionine/tyrosine aminotransferase
VSLVPKAEQGFGLDLERLAQLITPRTRAFLVNYPNNPPARRSAARRAGRTGQALRGQRVVS